MQFAGPIPAETITIPPGADGVRATLRLMVTLVKRYKVHPVIRELAREIIHGIPAHHIFAQLAALQAFVRDRIPYVRDVAAVETLQTPIVTLGYREPRYGVVEQGGIIGGDCDDQSTLLGSLMQAVGLPGAFCAIKVAGEAQHSHVLVEGRIRSRTRVDYIPLETIVPGAGPGWLPPDVTCFMLAHFG